MSATDADNGVFGQITYSIDSATIAKDTFTVDNDGKKAASSNKLISGCFPTACSQLADHLLQS